jgi:hypothetical protein
MFYWKTRISLVCIILVSLLLPFSVAIAGDLAASPAVITIENLILGQTTFIHDIEIINQSSQEKTFIIYCKKPSMLREGYQEIVDPRWIYLDKTEVIVEANSKELVGVSVHIPNNKLNSEKKYEAWVVARDKTNGLVALELAIRVLMTTSQYNNNVPDEAQPLEPIPVDTLPIQATPVTQVSPTTGTILTTTPFSINSPIPKTTTEPKLGSNQFPIIPVAGISAGTIIIVTLIITLLGRKKR